MNQRILIAGVPRAGKTTLAKRLGLELGVEPRHTDMLINLGWSESSAAAAKWINEPGTWIIEGVAVGRALRKWVAANDGIPAETIYWMPFNRVTLSGGQAAMANGCVTVWNEVLRVLASRGIRPIQIDSRG